MQFLDPASSVQLIRRRLRRCLRRILRPIAAALTEPQTTGSRQRRRWINALAMSCRATVMPALVAAGSAGAAPGPVAMLCDNAARVAAAQTGVPLDVLRALALTETGRNLAGTLRPWPWALNVQGDGRWLDDQAATLGMAQREIDRGVRNIDLGCFQINYRWHGEHFDSLAQMLDPTANALYAADFIESLHRETGSWVAAAGAYHSRTPAHAQRYRQRFRRILAGLDGQVTDAPSEAPARSRGRAGGRVAAGGPIIGDAGAGQMGSLFSATSAARRPMVPIGAVGAGVLR